MSGLKNKFEAFKNPRLQVTVVMILLSFFAMLLWFNKVNNRQAASAIMAKVRFEGQYRIGDGRWQEIDETKHIPSTKGDVTLRGNFHMYAPDGEYIGVYNDDIPVAFYTDHINMSFNYPDGQRRNLDMENSLFGVSSCGTGWTAVSVASDVEGPIEILVHNPHNFGNETAIDDMLSGIALWAGIDFERGVMTKGDLQRYVGLLFVVVALVLVGSALFSTLLKIQSTQVIWLFGAAILSAGIYLLYSATGVTFWSESVANNTTILVASMMFYMLFISGIITYFLEKTKNTGYIVTILSGTAVAAFLTLPLTGAVYFYDMLMPWAVLQNIANMVLLICLAKEFLCADKNTRWVHFALSFMLVAFGADIFATAAGWWKGGLISKYVFFVLFALALFIVLRIIPESINAAQKAKELELQRSQLEAEKNIVEAELKESRISIMLSQIQPHFIYNTLGTIERMCLKDPEKAFHLVRNFSLYLRGNFSELDSVTPIRFAQELKHVEYYVNIEKVRFPDMNIEYDVQATDFLLPALSVQPLVENAIKHGLMRLEEGGTVLIRSYETDTHFCVEVKDDGVGFDTSAPVDGKKHVGLRNIRGRLKAMVNGRLILESAENTGTTATIMIPKEVTV